MIIFIDMDDTIEKLLVAWLDCINKKYNRNVTYEDIKSWDVTLAFDGLTREQVYGPVKNDDDFWKTVKPMPGAPEAIKRLIDKGNQVYIVTATPYRSVVSKMDNVLFKYFPYLKWDDVIITSHKQLLHGDVMIDDGPHNLEGGDYFKILVDCPHNRSYDAEKNGMVRAKNWIEIEKILDGLTENEK